MQQRIEFWLEQSILMPYTYIQLIYLETIMQKWYDHLNG